MQAGIIKMRKLILKCAAAACAAAVLGCAAWTGRDEIGGAELAQEVRSADVHVKESRTLSGLAKLEASLSDYTKTEGKIPPNLETLIPKYLAAMPIVETGVPGHKDTSSVRSYQSQVLVDGRVDGTKLDDTGKWGYVFNDRQIVVFVDCTHRAVDGSPWYQHRGVY